MNNIHSTAIVSSKAKLGQNVNIGPYCIINSNVILGNNCNLKANVYIAWVYRNWRKLYLFGPIFIYRY